MNGEKRTDPTLWFCGQRPDLVSAAHWAVNSDQPESMLREAVNEAYNHTVRLSHPRLDYLNTLYVLFDGHGLAHVISKRVTRDYLSLLLNATPAGVRPVLAEKGIEARDLLTEEGTITGGVAGPDLAVLLVALTNVWFGRGARLRGRRDRVLREVLAVALDVWPSDQARYADSSIA